MEETLGGRGPPRAVVPLEEEEEEEVHIQICSEDRGFRLCNVTLYQYMLLFYVGARIAQSGQRLRYGLDGPGFETRLEKEILCSPYLSILALGPTQPPSQRVQELFFWGKAAWAWR